jgi:hypothetical protein
MMKVFIMYFVSLCFAVIAVVMWAGPAYAPPKPKSTDLQQQINNLKAENAAAKRGLCNSVNNSFSGTVESPRYRDNCDGTVSDRDTGLMWEKKVAGDSGSCLDDDKLHSVPATCDWFDATGAWITKVNNTCNNDPSVDCTAGGDVDCINASVGGECGFAGYRDWRVPEVDQDGGTEELETIVDSSEGTCGEGTEIQGACINPIFGPTAFSNANYWSSITTDDNTDRAYVLQSSTTGVVIDFPKVNSFHVRAVRP